jgi:hypothetical protein
MATHMKGTVLGIVLPVVAAVSALAQAPAGQKHAATAPVVKCKGPDGKPCTSKQVQALADAVFAAKRQHDVLATVKNLILASPDGTVQCEQNDGSACTAPQLDVVKEIAAGQQLFINYRVTNSGK